MEKKLNKLEQAVINEVIRFNEKKYSFIKSHIPYLMVKNREKTGVGMYVYFEYSTKDFSSNKIDASLSSDKSLELDVLKYGLNYELNITNGRLSFLELVTNGESWDGNYSSFKLL